MCPDPGRECPQTGLGGWLPPQQAASVGVTLVLFKPRRAARAHPGGHGCGAHRQAEQFGSYGTTQREVGDESQREGVRGVVQRGVSDARTDFERLEDQIVEGVEGRDGDGDAGTLGGPCEPQLDIRFRLPRSEGALDENRVASRSEPLGESQPQQITLGRQRFVVDESRLQEPLGPERYPGFEIALLDEPQVVDASCPETGTGLPAVPSVGFRERERGGDDVEVVLGVHRFVEPLQDPAVAGPSVGAAGTVENREPDTLLPAEERGPGRRSVRRIGLGGSATRKEHERKDGGPGKGERAQELRWRLR